MVNIVLTLLALAASATASPVQVAALEARQADMPSECTDYYSGLSGHVCITRPTNCEYTTSLHCLVRSN